MILSEVFWYMERSKDLERNFITVQKKFKEFDRRDTVFLDIEKSNSKRVFSNDSKCKTVIRG